MARVRGARERREGAGNATLQGVGAEFVGYRPYRPGENLRALDWNLYARLDRPFVRVARREASESWAILLDASASMGVGVPGKLQAGAELATALAGLGLGLGASVELIISGDAPRSMLVRKKVQLPGWLSLLEQVRASGTAGLGALIENPARFRSAGRVFAIGDLLDVESRALFSLARRGRELLCAQVLAPEELAPDEAASAVVWVDAESGERHRLELDRGIREGYERELGEALEAWRAAAARHRVGFGSFSSDTPFEEICAALLPV